MNIWVNEDSCLGQSPSVFHIGPIISQGASEESCQGVVSGIGASQVEEPLVSATPSPHSQGDALSSSC